MSENLIVMPERSGTHITLSIDSIRTDSGAHMRAHGDLDVDQMVKDLIEADAVLPPVPVFQDGDGQIWLAGGFQRFAAWKRAGRTEVPTELRHGTRDDAILFGCGANDRQEHGRRRTRTDIKKAVETLLREPKWRERGDEWIAEQCRTDVNTVDSVRTTLQRSGVLPRSEPPPAPQPTPAAWQPSPHVQPGPHSEGRAPTTPASPSFTTPSTPPRLVPNPARQRREEMIEELEECGKKLIGGVSVAEQSRIGNRLIRLAKALAEGKV